MEKSTNIIYFDKSETSEDKHTGIITSITVLGNDLLASTSTDQKVMIWKIKEGKAIHYKTLDVPTGFLPSISLFSKYLVGVTSQFDRLQMWNIKEHYLKREEILSEHYPKSVLCLAEVDDETLVTGSDDKTIKVWDFKAGKRLVKTLTGHKSSVNCIAVIRPNKSDQMVLLASGAIKRPPENSEDDPAIKIWNMHTGECIKTLNGHKAGIVSLISLFDGRLVSASIDQTIKIWDINTGNCLATLPVNNGVSSIALLSSNYLLSVGGNKITLWNIKDYELIESREVDAPNIQRVAVMPNGYLVIAADVATHDKNIMLGELKIYSTVFAKKLLPEKEKILSFDFRLEAMNPQELNNTFVQAVKENNFYEVSKLLAKGADINTQDEKGFTALHLAIIHGIDSALFFYLAERSPNSLQNNTNNIKHLSLTYLAAANGKLDILNYLIKLGYLNHEPDYEGTTPVMVTGNQGHLNVAKLLSENGANINSRNKIGLTPLLSAAINGHIDVMNWLVKEKLVDIEEKSYSGETALLLATRNKKKKALEWLLVNKANVNAVNINGENAAIIAAKNNSWDIVKFLLLQDNVDLNIQDKDGWSVLHLLCKHGQKQIVKDLLVYKQINIEILTNEGYTSLHVAAAMDQDDIIYILLNNNANIDCKDNMGATPLHLAVFHNHVVPTRLLLKHNANINARTIAKETPLHVAAAKGYKEIAVELLTKGADPTLRESDKNKTPLELARDNNHFAVIEVLEKDLGKYQNDLNQVSDRRNIMDRRSEIDSTIRITRDNWALHLVRKVDKGNVQHVFILLEGYELDKHFIHYFELVTPDKINSVIRIEYCENCNITKFLYKLTLNDLRGVSLAAESWNIRPDYAKGLKNSIEEEKNKIDTETLLIKYQILGDESISGASSSHRGHSCFTWAREKINNLPDPNIRIEKKFTDWIAAVPSIYIKDPRSNNIFWTTPKIIVGGVICTAVGLGAGITVLKSAERGKSSCIIS